MLTKVCSALTMLDRRSTASGVQCCARTPSSAFKYACTDDSQPLSHAHVCKVVHLLERRLCTPIQHTPQLNASFIAYVRPPFRSAAFLCNWTKATDILRTACNLAKCMGHNRYQELVWRKHRLWITDIMSAWVLISPG